MGMLSDEEMENALYVNLCNNDWHERPTYPVDQEHAQVLISILGARRPKGRLSNDNTK